MAFYEYQCAKCGTSFEKRVSISDRAKSVPCPTCGSKRVKRKMSMFSASTGSSAAASSGASCAPGGG